MARRDASADQTVSGRFYTNGQKFVVTLNDLPFSGSGDSLDQAFANLLHQKDDAGTLAQDLRDFAVEQHSAAGRAGMGRLMVAGILALTVLGGALGGAALLAPRVVADISATTLSELRKSIAELSPSERTDLIGVQTGEAPDTSGQ